MKKGAHLIAGVIIIVIIILAFIIILYSSLYLERNYKYKTFEAYCHYSSVNISFEETTSTFKNEENITIYRIDQGNNGINEANGVDFPYVK